MKIVLVLKSPMELAELRSVLSYYCLKGCRYPEEGGCPDGCGILPLREKVIKEVQALESIKQKEGKNGQV